MAELKKNYSFSNKRNIWRLIPSESGFLVIEERDTQSKEVFFNCLRTKDGEVLFKNLQLEDKYWIGIEAVHKNFIYLHKFRKPDMPGHMGIYALDILTQKITWKNDDLIFLLAKDDKVYAYQTAFEGRQYFLLSALTGKIIDDLGSEVKEINKIREESIQNDFSNNFIVPNKFIQNQDADNVSAIINRVFNNGEISGEVQCIEYENLVMFSYNVKNTGNTYDNFFEVFDVFGNQKLLKEKLNSNSKNLVYKSFFVLGDLLFVLVEKTKLVVYRIMQ